MHMYRPEGHVRWVRNVSFAVLGVSSAALLTYPLLLRAVVRFLDWAEKNMDAGDWIAIAALAVAVVGTVLAIASARAAVSSATSARKALGIAERSADAAVASARATEIAADAASRMTLLEETKYHEGRAPKWALDLAAPVDNYCLLTITYEGPLNDVSAGLFVHAHMWGPDVDGHRQGGIIAKFFSRSDLVPGDQWVERLEVGQGVDLDQVEIQVAKITAVENLEPTSEALRYWEWKTSKDSPRKDRPGSIFVV